MLLTGNKTRTALGATVALSLFSVFAAPREEILSWFEKNVYGAIPPKPAELSFVLAEKGEAFGGLAERRQYVVRARDAKGAHAFDVLVYLPRGAERSAPAFVYPNFSGNHSITPDESVKIDDGWVCGGKRRARGERVDRIPVRRILERGFALATFNYNAVYPDYAPEKKDAASDSVYAIFPEAKLKKPLLAHPAWSWGAMRVRDLLETLPEIDQTRVAIVGQSRMGKNAIVTGVNDDRFALVVANCGGTKPLKYLPNLRCPFWFADGLKRYARNGETGQDPATLAAAAAKFPDPPFDQWDYMALIAPRAFYVGAASADRWAPPDVSRACVMKAEPAFEACGRTIGFHVKEGPHSITHADWEKFIDFALDQLGWSSAGCGIM